MTSCSYAYISIHMTCMHMYAYVCSHKSFRAICLMSHNWMHFRCHGICWLWKTAIMSSCCLGGQAADIDCDWLKQLKRVTAGAIFCLKQNCFKLFSQGYTTHLEFLETWKCQGICAVREIWLWQLIHMNCAWTMMCMDTFSDHHITYLYFIGTVINFSYVMFTANSDQ